MKSVIGLLPLGIGVAIIGAAAWILLDRDIGIGTWLLAALLLAHGWVHVMFVFPRPEATAATAGGTPWPFDMGRSWLIAGVGLDAGAVRSSGIVVMAVTLVTFVMAALATVGLLIPAEWWAGLMIAGAAGSTLMLLLFFSPTLLLGLAINLALVWLVVSAAWSPTAALPGAAAG